MLVTKPDFQNEFTRTNLHSTLHELMSLNIIPIINANDTVAPPPEPDKDLAGVSRVSHCHIRRNFVGNEILPLSYFFQWSKT